MVFERIAEAVFWLEGNGFRQVDVFGQEFAHADGRAAVIKPQNRNFGFSPCSVSIDESKELVT
jgi:hypothetical protein